ncbi:transcription factor bHLH123 [Prunus yedoensis var. nudiflora]|uniref:Transcription factor bHLH123 n=2 Tax=Prunus TaxID=3754 RepID=A0A314UY34_PRUYE|nr:transcription factor bHLH123-like [Prunus avium]PQM42333.1 transcription factor bHLH123 [Prunus yedoensis var. nudiflora]
MADEFQTTGNWWDSSTRTRFETGTSPPSSTLNSLGSFGWQPDMVDIKARSSMDSGSVSGTSSMVFHGAHKLEEGPDSATGSGGDPSLHMMGLGLSSQPTDWNHALFRGEKAETSFRSILQENMNSNTNFHQENDQQLQWRDKLFAGGCGDSSNNEFKQMNRGFSLDQTQFSPQYSSGDSTVTCQGLPSSFQMDSGAALYGSPSTILQGLLGPHHDNQQPNSAPMNFPYQANYGVNSSDQLLPSWSKVPQFLRTSPPKQPPQSHLQFSNNATFWNAPHEAAMKDVRPSFFPSLQQQFPTARFEEKPKNISEVQESGAVGKKSGSETASKRPRNETSSPLPAFKVRKEKMGDRITALQQLVSPFGKTDTASVLSEAIEYIKFLHEQVNVLSTPYMKSGAAIQHQQNTDKSKDPDQGPKQDLRSRGLCLVPVSSTFPVTHGTTVDFWTPTFGGTFR